jgi:hypothetical protein
MSAAAHLVDDEAASPIPRVDDESWGVFVETMAEPACAGVVNDAGFVGLFLFSMARLGALGVVTRLRREPRDDGGSAWVGEFVPPLTLETFLSEPLLQYRAFKRSCGEYYRQLEPLVVPSVIDGVEASLSGLLAVAHRAGFKGLGKWLMSAEDRVGHPFTTETFLRANGVF